MNKPCCIFIQTDRGYWKGYSCNGYWKRVNHPWFVIEDDSVKCVDVTRWWYLRLYEDVVVTKCVQILPPFITEGGGQRKNLVRQGTPKLCRHKLIYGQKNLRPDVLGATFATV
jgi:hypothetical protein